MIRKIRLWFFHLLVKLLVNNQNLKNKKMNIRNFNLKIYFILFFVFLTGPVFSQNRVQVRLQQPPPNQLRASDLWKLTLNNTTRTTYNIILEGTLDEAEAGRVATGNSGTISLPPGIKSITYNDVKRGGSVNFKSGKWQEAFTRTGNAPSGDYTICIYVKSEGGDELGSDCIQQNIEIVSGPTLISPSDEETIPDQQTPIFTWLTQTPPQQGARYKIIVVEIRGGQSADEAIRVNPEWFTMDNISSTSFQFPISAKSFELYKKYAWQIRAYKKNNETGKSETWSFIYGSKEVTEKIAEKIIEIKQCDVFKVEFKKTSLGDTICYKLLITNNYAGKSPGNKPGGFRLAVKGDSIGSIAGGVSDGWKRTPSKFPPGSGSVHWKIASGDFPNSETDLGNIIFRGYTSNPTKVLYEWLDKDDSLICKDSTIIIHELKYYHDLSQEIPDNFIEMPNSFLNVQYVNNYAAVDNIILNIYDVEKYELVKLKSKKGDKPNSVNKDYQNLSFNGLNRISINLKDYELLPKTTYLLSVSNSTNNYYLNFKVTNQNEK